MPIRVLALLAVGACGRIGFLELGLDHDAGSGSIDGPGICQGTGAFTGLQQLANVNSLAAEDSAEISRDGLSIYLNASNALAFSTRPTVADGFSAPVPIASLNAGGPASDPSVTADNLEMLFSSDRGGLPCIYRATRATTAAEWGGLTLIPALCSGSSTGGPAISGDGLTVVYNTQLDVLGEGDLFISHRTSRAVEFAAGQKLANLPASTGYAWLSADQLRLYFEHTVSMGNQVIELERAFRISPSDDFTNVQPIAELDDAGNSSTVDISLDPTESVVYFATNRAGGANDLWSAERPCL